MLMPSHLDWLTSRPIFFNYVVHFRMSAKADSVGPPNVASSKYHMFISDNSDDATCSTAIAKRTGPGDRLVECQWQSRSGDQTRER